MAVDTSIVVDEAARDGDAQLLRRYRPLILLDSQEDFRPLSAASIAENPGNVLEAGGRVVAGTHGEGGHQLSLKLLAEDTEGLAYVEDDRFKEAPFPFVAARRLQTDPALANRVYGRVARTDDQDGSRTFLQYWIWFYYNPKNLLGRGKHEGDWELVQIELDADLEPTILTYAQHGRGRRKDATPDDFHVCRNPCEDDCRHPKVYVAPFSHASYFEPGSHVYFLGIDSPDGCSREALPEVETLGEWQSWPGRWGQDRGTVGASPRSPACQTSQWDPVTFHARARDHTPLNQHWTWRLGQRTAPLAPHIESAVLREHSVTVRWRVDRRLGLRPAWLLVTVHAADTEGDDAVPGAVIRRRTIRVDASCGQANIPLSPGHPEHLFVQASVFNGLRQRSDTSNACRLVPDAEPSLCWDEWSPAVWRAVQRRLLKDLDERGAATIAELEARRVNVLELALTRDELVKVVDSSRRAGLVQALGHERDAAGTVLTEPEWALTDDGRKRIMPFGRWLRRLGALAPPAILIALSKDVVAPWLEKTDKQLALLIAAFLLMAVLGSSVLLYRRASGASTRTIARAWSRHAVDLPAFNRHLTWWSWRVTLTAVAALTGYVGSIALDLVLPPSGVWTALFLLILVTSGLVWMTLYVVVLTRWGTASQLRAEAKAWRESSGPSRAARARTAVHHLGRGRRRRRRKVRARRG